MWEGHRKEGERVNRKEGGKQERGGRDRKERGGGGGRDLLIVRLYLVVESSEQVPALWRHVTSSARVSSRAISHTSYVPGSAGEMPEAVGSRAEQKAPGHVVWWRPNRSSFLSMRSLWSRSNLPPPSSAEKCDPFLD